MPSHPDSGMKLDAEALWARFDDLLQDQRDAGFALSALVAEQRAEEREACAKLVDSYSWATSHDAFARCALAIRARGGK